jgi:predicted dehydrogenase
MTVESPARPPAFAARKDVYTAALIGAGRIGMLLEDDPKRVKPATHFGMWAGHPRARLAAVCDSDPKRLEFAKAKLPGVRAFTDPGRMLAEVKPDVVSIATWKDTHHAMAKLALAHGVRAIVLEKPIAERYEHAREIVEEARSKGVHLLVNHRRRFDPLVRRLRDDLKNGLIGEILQVSCCYVYGLVTTGTHLIDTLRMLLKDVAGEIAWVSAFPNAFETLHPDGDPNVDGFVGFENGLKAAVQSLSMKDYDIFDVHIYGRRGKVLFRNIGRDIEVIPVVESVEHRGFTELASEPAERRGGKPRDLFRSLADNAVACLDGTATSLSTGEDSLKALAVLLAMRRSAADGGRVVDI